MRMYKRGCRVALRYHLRIVAAIIVLAPQLAAADELPPISEDHWPRTHLYLPSVSRTVDR